MKKIHKYTDSSWEIVAYLFTLIGLSGTAFHFLEGETFLRSFYWATITATSVGYGDISPKTSAGMILAMATAIFGLIVLALLIAKHLSYVKKPILAREGANIQIVKEGTVVAESEGKYSAGDCVYQELFNIPDFGGGKYPVIGSWCVDGVAVGMGIREDGLITGNNAKFIPHIIEG